MALWLVTVGSDSRVGYPRSQRLDDRPCPAVQAWGVDGVAKHQAWIEEADGDPLAGLSAAEARAIAMDVHRAGRAAREGARR